MLREAHSILLLGEDVLDAARPLARRIGVTDGLFAMDLASKAVPYPALISPSPHQCCAASGGDEARIHDRGCHG